MNITPRDKMMQRWNQVQYSLIPELQDDMGIMTPKLEKLIHVLDFVRIEEYVGNSWVGVGRPPHERAWLANAFVAKSVLNIGTTVGLIDRLSNDRVLRRICGFALNKALPSEATFSRAFDELSAGALAERVHAALITENLGEQLIGHISRDATAIEVRERPVVRKKPEEEKAATEPVAATTPKKRGCDRLAKVDQGVEYHIDVIVVKMRQYGI